MTGHLFAAMQIRRIQEEIDEWIRVFRNTKPAPGTAGPLIPGDPEREAEAIRSEEGFPLLKPVVGDFCWILRRGGIALDVE